MQIVTKREKEHSTNSRQKRFSKRLARDKKGHYILMMLVKVSVEDRTSVSF
jgi:hypothetical protein